MGSVIIGGRSLALFLTLIATPVVYSWLDDLARPHPVRAVVAATRPRLRRHCGAVASASPRRPRPRRSPLAGCTRLTPQG